MHSPHKLSEHDLEMYSRYSAQIKDLEQKVQAMKAAGKDISDIDMELKLAKNKLKEDQIRMVEIYLESIIQKIN